MRCPSPFPALIGLVVLSSAAGALRVGSGGLGGLFSYGALGGSIYEQCKASGALRRSRRDLVISR